MAWSSPLLRSALVVLGACLLSGVPAPARALTPQEVLVVANRNARGSVDLASYYMKRRAIPDANLLTLRVTDAESCSRPEYDERIAEPVRLRLRSDAGRGIRAVALLYGVPLRILPLHQTPEEKATLALLEREERELSGQDNAAGGSGGDDRTQLRERLSDLRSRIDALRKPEQEASVDSELALVRVPEYDLGGWVPNPLFLGNRGQKLPTERRDVLLVSRLDGPSEAVVRRIIDDSLDAERSGLAGTAYLDARWKDPGDGKNLSGYALYDKSVHEAGAALKKKGIPVVVEDTEALFPAGSRLPAALYCGWYSLARYVEAFNWQKGAVGYHIASGECTTLRKKGSTEWCQRMLEEGVAATVGPVSEPYVQAFPPPHLFLQLLTDGRLTLAETYLLSLPYLSWKMVLIGDPLYRPFARPPAAGAQEGKGN